MNFQANSIQNRLMLYVSLGMVVFSILAGAVIYRIAVLHELDDAAAVESQLVQIVQTQAEVAVFANNVQIAEGVIAGLRNNPGIRAVRISGEGPGALNVSAGLVFGRSEADAHKYPLYSPLNPDVRIGELMIARNVELTGAQATLSAIRTTFMMLLQIAASAVLILVFSHYQISKPVADLAQSIAAIEPGSGDRLAVPATHASNEIGSLAKSANTLLEAAEKALAEVRELATTDPLTGLFNRRAFMARIDNELARIKRYELPAACVLMLDLDHFKQVNDQYGHAAGDAVLRNFGRILASQLRQVDSAGRIGGEEFAVVLPATDTDAASTFAERLRQIAADTETRHGNHALRMTVSIGITQMQNSDARPDDALARADRALYRAKHAGRNRIEIDTGTA